MTIKFTKMHGLGNDFMIIDGINQNFEPNSEQLKAWADRHFGVGFDQLLLVEESQLTEAEFKYRIFNADGSEVEQCGNGARCFARFVREKGLTTHSVIPVETAKGVITLEMMNETDVRVNMGPPVFSPELIPLNASAQAQYDIDFQGEKIKFSAVSMGNPHAVIIVDDINIAQVESIGEHIQSSNLFPQSVNVGFMQIMDEQNIKCRVFERGVGETIACGTGACAAVVAGIKLNCLSANVSVHLPAGSLEIQWQGNNEPVFMTGTTASVFEGELNE